MGKSCGIKTMISKKSTTTHIVIFLPLEVILSGYAFRSNIYLQKIGLSRINSFDFYYIFRVLSLLVYNSLLIQTTLSWSIWTLSQIMYFHTLVQSFILYIRVKSYSCSYDKSYCCDFLFLSCEIISFSYEKIINLLSNTLDMVLQDQTYVIILI